jgi:ATP-dependent protease ClpP protease subunit
MQTTGRKMEIHLHQPILESEDFVKSVRDADVDEIVLYINSPGGYVTDGNAMYNVLVEHDALVLAQVEGVAASMASVIAMAADEIRIAENAFFMIHNPFAMAIGDSREMKNRADLLDKMKANAIKAYRRHMKKTDEEISALMDDETWVDAEMALEMGMAGEIYNVFEEGGEEQDMMYDFKFLKDNGVEIPGYVYNRLCGVPACAVGACMTAQSPQMPYKNEHVCSFRDADNYDRIRSTIREHDGKQYRVLLGFKGDSGNAEEISYRYKTDTWSEQDAREHCEEHNGKFEPAVDDNQSNNSLQHGNRPARYSFRVIDTEELKNQNTPKRSADMTFDEKGNLVDEQGAIVIAVNELPDRIKNQQSGDGGAKKQAKAQAFKEYKAYFNEVDKLCKNMGVSDELRDELMKSEEPDINAARAKIIDAHLENTTQSAVDGQPGNTYHGVSVGKDAEDKKREGLTTAMLIRGGIEKDPKVIQENRQSEYAGYGLKAMAKQALYDAGDQRAFVKSDTEVAHDFMKGLQAHPSMANSINPETLISVASTSANKSVLKGLEQWPATFRNFVTEKSFNDLKQHEMYDFSEAPDLLEIGTSQAAKMAKFQDVKETAQLKKFGRAWSIDEEAIINDDVNAFTETPRKFGAAVPRKQNYHFWSYALADATNGHLGPTLNRSGLPFFNADTQGNYSGDHHGISETTLSAGIQAMMQFTLQSPEGDNETEDIFTNVPPRYIAVPPALMVTANKYTSSQYTPSKNNNETNPFGPQGMWNLTPVAEPLISHLTGYNSFILAADPNAFDYAVIATLSGRNTPEVVSRVGGAGEVKGIIFDITHYWVVSFVNWRGMYQHRGSTVS